MTPKYLNEFVSKAESRRLYKAYLEDRQIDGSFMDFVRKIKPIKNQTMHKLPINKIPINKEPFIPKTQAELSKVGVNKIQTTKINWNKYILGESDKDIVAYAVKNGLSRISLLGKSRISGQIESCICVRDGTNLSIFPLVSWAAVNWQAYAIVRNPQTYL
jgi:hypothetical protein